MTILCLEDFKLEFEKLPKKNSYSSIETKFREFNKEKDMLISPIDITVRDEMDKVNTEDKQTVLANFSAGIRIGFRF